MTRVQPMVSSDFDPDGLVQAKRLIDELEAKLRPGRSDFTEMDPRKLLRVLHILADQIEILRVESG